MYHTHKAVLVPAIQFQCLLNGIWLPEVRTPPPNMTGIIRGQLPYKQPVCSAYIPRKPQMAAYHQIQQLVRGILKVRYHIGNAL